MDFLVMLLFLIPFITDRVSGHGRLWEPPARSTMWRRGYNTPVNPNDNELNCGGYMNQWFRLSGKCGICGDPFNVHPRPNEAGGKYATGAISGEYATGDVIDLGVQLTANHLGYFEFRICPSTGRGHVTQNCLNKYPIRVIGSHDGRYHVKKNDHGLVKLRGKLPEGLNCKHCVLQWRYRSGNRWSCDMRKGKCGKGFGSQEEFYGCADVTIRPIDQTVPQLRRGNHRYASSPEIKVMRKSVAKKRKLVYSHSNSAQNVNIHKVSDVLLSLLKVVSSATRSRGRQAAHIKWDPIGGLFGKDVVQFNNFRDSHEIDDWEPRIIEADLPFDSDDYSSFLLSEISSPHDLKTPIRMVDDRIKYPRVFNPPPQRKHRRVVKTERVCYGTPKYTHVSGIANWCNVNCRAGNCPDTICTCQMKKVFKTSGDKSVDIQRSRHGPKTKTMRSKSKSSFSPTYPSVAIDTKRILPVSRPKPTMRSLGKGVFRKVDNSRHLVSQVLHSHERITYPKPVVRKVKNRTLVKSPRKRCLAIGRFSRRTMDEWCDHHCPKGFCPHNMCKCFTL